MDNKIYVLLMELAKVNPGVSLQLSPIKEREPIFDIGRYLLKVNDLIVEPISDKSRIIDWVRSAETCTTKEQGYDEWFKIGNNANNTFYNIENIVSKDSDILSSLTEKKSQPSKETLPSGTTTRLFSYMSAPSSSDCTITYYGIIQSIRLNQFIKKQQQIYSVCICAPLVKTIMTAMISLRGTGIPIYVVPYIHDYNAGCFEPIILKKKIKIIKEWFRENWLQLFDDIEIIEDLKHIHSTDISDLSKEKIEIYLYYRKNKIQIDTNLRGLIEDICYEYIEALKEGQYDNIDLAKFFKKYNNLDNFINLPKVNLSIYQNEFNNPSLKGYVRGSIAQTPNKDRFNKDILPQLYQKLSTNYGTKMIAFSTKGYMQTEIPSVQTIIPTQIIRVEYTRDTTGAETVHTTDDVYFNRTNYNEYRYNTRIDGDLFERNNIDVCSGLNKLQENIYRGTETIANNKITLPIQADNAFIRNDTDRFDKMIQSTDKVDLIGGMRLVKTM